MKIKTSAVCNVISLALVIAFAVRTAADYIQYSAALNSAPFYVWVLADALLLVLPAIVVFAVGRFAKKKQ